MSLSAVVPVILFDLDGTLVDTAPDLAMAANHALKQAGYPSLDLSVLQSFVSHGARTLLQRGLDAHGAGVVDDVLFERMIADFLDYYQHHLDVQSRPYPGLVELLERLAAGGVGLGVCSNKREDLARQVLLRLDLLRFFDRVIGGDSCAAMKPDPRPVQAGLAHFDADPGAALMVGDCLVDQQAARAAGVAFALVSFGYGGGDIDEESCEVVIGDYRQPPMIQRSGQIAAIEAMRSAYDSTARYRFPDS